jgi:hypothetical protein
MGEEKYCTQPWLYHMTIINQELIVVNTTSEKSLCSNGGVYQDNAAFRMVVSKGGQVILTNKSRLQDIYNTFTLHRAEENGVLCATKTILLLERYLHQLGKKQYNNNYLQ